MKFCIECGVSFEPNSNAQKYCGSCKIEVRRVQVRDAVRLYRQTWDWNNKNPKGSKNALLGSKPRKNIEDEEKTVHKERVRLLGTKKYLSKFYCITLDFEDNQKQRERLEV